MKHFMAKLGRMRKAVDWIVYPVKDPNDPLIIQSDRRIARFDRNTGKGRLSASHTYPGFLALSLPGCEDIEVPEDVRRAAIDCIPHSGDRIGSGVTLA